VWVVCLAYSVVCVPGIQCGLCAWRTVWVMSLAYSVVCVPGVQCGLCPLHTLWVVCLAYSVDYVLACSVGCVPGIHCGFVCLAYSVGCVPGVQCTVPNRNLRRRDHHHINARQQHRNNPTRLMWHIIKLYNGSLHILAFPPL